MQKIVWSLIFSVLSTGILSAQQVRPERSAEIYRDIHRLNKLVNVLYFAAHPDDENTRLLAWLVNDQYVRTGYLSLTRGDGGQNLLGTEQGAALGLIRTYELAEARKLDGAEQFFTRANDFGFSKNYQETFTHWDKDVITADAVWTIRKFRPDVIITRFPPDARAGHGHHAASAIIATAAFTSSSDQNRFPEQLRYFSVWKPKRLLFNAFRFSSGNTITNDQFMLKIGQYNPLLGMGYGELAGLSRSMHKSQGAGTPSVPGIQAESFDLVDGESFNSSLFDGIDTTWKRVNRPDIGIKIEAIADSFDFKQPSLSIPALLEVRKLISGVKDDYWRTEKLKETDRIILSCAGFMAEAFSRQAEALAGESVPFSLNIISRAELPVILKSVEWPGQKTVQNRLLSRDTLISLETTLTIPENTPVTEPYWLSLPPVNADNYLIPSDSLIGLPETPNRLTALLRLSIGGEDFIVHAPLSYKRLDPRKGDVVEAIRIVPAVELSFTQSLLVAEQGKALYAKIRISPSKNTEGKLILQHKGQVLAQVNTVRLKAGADTVITVPVNAEQISKISADNFVMDAVFDSGDQKFNRSMHLIEYDHLPALQYFTPSSLKVLRKNWKSAAKHIGFIPGAGDKTADILRLAGLSVTVLTDADFNNPESLQQYDAILTGVRAVNTNRKMKQWLPLLHRYVQKGGTLVMQYNTMQTLATYEIGPYPFTLSNQRVTEEDADVKFLNPGHQVLNYPNKISQTDFKDWVQERGLNFPSSWNSEYQPLFSMHDTGEPALEGATLYLKYGKGTFIYSSLSFFRQLPAGNQGAIRLLLNFLSAGK